MGYKKITKAALMILLINDCFKSLLIVVFFIFIYEHVISSLITDISDNDEYSDIFKTFSKKMILGANYYYSLK